VTKKGWAYLVFVWCVSTGLIYYGMRLTGSSFPLFGLAIPAVISVGFAGKDR